MPPGLRSGGLGVSEHWEGPWWGTKAASSLNSGLLTKTYVLMEAAEQRLLKCKPTSQKDLGPTAGFAACTPSSWASHLNSVSFNLLLCKQREGENSALEALRKLRLYRAPVSTHEARAKVLQVVVVGGNVPATRTGTSRGGGSH